MKTLLIKKNESMLFPDKTDLSDVKICSMYKKTGGILQKVRMVLLFLGGPFSDFFYNKKLISEEADLFIVQDADARIPFLKWLRKNHPKSRIILWYWNTVEECRRYLDPEKIPDSIEKWSYSKYDCLKYGMNYNTTFLPEVPKIIGTDDICTDVFFVGKDKGRLDKLLEIKKLLESHKLDVDFHICKNRNRDKDNEIYKKPIPYAEILEKIKTSRVILDCCVSENAGPTIRPIEALMYRKKLITDNKAVMDEDYYCRDNIFVLGIDNNDTLRDFVMSPYKQIDNEIVIKYTFGEWIRRF